MDELADVAFGKRLGETELGGFVSGVAIGSEHDVHQWREVGVISSKAFFGVMPMMQFRRTDQHSQRTEWQAHVRVDVDRPNSTKRGEARERGEIKA